MELRDYLTVFSRGKWFISLSTLGIVLLTVVLTSTAKVKYDTNMVLTVDRLETLNQKTVPYYLYDDYYAIQASGLFADTVANLIQSPGIVKSAYDRAHVELPAVRNVAQIGKLFTLRKLPPASLSITIRSGDNLQSKTLFASLNDELSSRVDEINQNHPTDRFVLRATEPVSTQVKPFWALNITLAALIGFILATFLALLSVYIQDTKAHK